MNKTEKFFPINNGKIRNSFPEVWVSRNLNIEPDTFYDSDGYMFDLSLSCSVKYRYTSNKERMYFPKNLDIFDSIYVEKKGNSYKLIAKKYFHIHGEIDLRAELTKMEELQVCNIEFFPYLMEENNITIYKQVKCKDQFGEYYDIEELPF